MKQKIRYLQVFEHEPVRISEQTEGSDNCFTEQEAELLMRINEQRRGFCQRGYHQVSFAQYCGIVRLPSRVVEVLPKTVKHIAAVGKLREQQIQRSRRVLLKMLNCVPGFPVKEIGTVDQSSTKLPLLEVFIAYFLKEVIQQVKRGLLTQYVAEGDNLLVLRGSLRWTQHLRVNQIRRDRFYCSYDELTVDNPYNRALRYTLSILRTWIKTPSIQQQWLEVWSVFSEIGHEQFSSSKVANLPRHRLVERYSTTLMWCEWFLSLHSPSLLAGTNHAPALLFDMNRLFESYVAFCKRRDYAGTSHIVHTQGPARFLATSSKTRIPNSFSLAPDITIFDRRSGKPIMIFDAKWKLVENGVSEKDIYQMLAYAMAYDCMDIFLVYPWIDGMTPLEEGAILEQYHVHLPSDDRRKVRISVQILKEMEGF